MPMLGFFPASSSGAVVAIWCELYPHAGGHPLGIPRRLPAAPSALAGGIMTPFMYGSDALRMREPCECQKPLGGQRQALSKKRLLRFPHRCYHFPRKKGGALLESLPRVCFAIEYGDMLMWQLGAHDAALRPSGAQEQRNACGGGGDSTFI